MQIRLILLDFDGTLADSAAWMMRAVNPMARRYGFKTVTDEEIEMLRGRSTPLTVCDVQGRAAIARRFGKHHTTILNGLRSLAELEGTTRHDAQD